MSRIAVTVEIDAPVERVWAEVERIEGHTEWMHDAVAIRFEGTQRTGVGTRFLCDTKVGPIKLVDRMEITEWIPLSRIGVRHTGIVTGTGAFVLTPIDLDRRTRFVWTEVLHFPWWLGGVIGERVGGNVVMKAIWRRNLRGLKGLIEPNR